MIDAVDLQIDGAADLAGEVTHGLHRHLAARIFLLPRADEDDPISSLDSVFYYQGYYLGGIEA